MVVINDLYENWKGTVRFRLLCDGKTITEETQPCEVAALGSQKLTFAVDIPRKPGSYTVEAALLSPGVQPVRSLRDFEVLRDITDRHPQRPASSSWPSSSNNISDFPCNFTPFSRLGYDVGLDAAAIAY